MTQQIESDRSLWAYEIVKDIPPLMDSLLEALLANHDFCRQITAIVLEENEGEQAQNRWTNFKKGDNDYAVRFSSEKSKIGNRKELFVQKTRKDQSSHIINSESIEIIIGDDEHVNRIGYRNGMLLTEPSVNTHLATNKTREFINDLQNGQ